MNLLLNLLLTFLRLFIPNIHYLLMISTQCLPSCLYIPAISSDVVTAMKLITGDNNRGIEGLMVFAPHP